MPALEQLRKQYHLDKLVFVADSGMFNEDNLQQLESQNFDYIVGARIKNVGQSLTDKILDKSQYKAFNKHIKVARFEHKGRTLVVTHSEKRAKKDRRDREKGIEKLRNKVKQQKSPKQYLSKQGYKKFLQIEGECDADITLKEQLRGGGGYSLLGEFLIKEN